MYNVESDISDVRLLSHGESSYFKQYLKIRFIRKWVLFPISSVTKENKKKTTEEMKLKEIFLKAVVFLQQSSTGEYIRNQGRPQITTSEKQSVLPALDTWPHLLTSG